MRLGFVKSGDGDGLWCGGGGCYVGDLAGCQGKIFWFLCGILFLLWREGHIF